MGHELCRLFVVFLKSDKTNNDWQALKYGTNWLIDFTQASSLRSVIKNESVVNFFWLHIKYKWTYVFYNAVILQI